MADDRYLSYMGKGPKRVPNYEHWSCPDAETYITGIDYYEHPRLCRQRLLELYPSLWLGVPESDAPKPRPKLGGDGAAVGDSGNTVRWGDSETGTFTHGEAIFKTPEQVFAFSPLAKADFTDWPHVVMNWDFSSEEAVYRKLRPSWPAEWGDRAPEGASASVGFYNTMFMWPMLTFGWELFLECCLDERFDRIMEEFAELNRRVFRAFARLPVNFVVCHDDIVTTKGPVCPPGWMRKHIFSRYEEFWGLVKAAGKEVVFMADGRMDAYVADVMALGARGIVSEPYTDFKRIARDYDNPFLAGEGDNRVLSQGGPDEIRAMVKSMAETAKLSGGYVMCLGNHLPWNLPPENVKCYLDCCQEFACR